MIPVIAIVGRPNVGKSTLFNRLTKTKDALVSNISGLTYDRKYGKAKFLRKEFIIIDTGGIYKSKNEIETNITFQSLLAVEEADIIFFVVDIYSRLMSVDYLIAKYLCSKKKDIFLLINKIDSLNTNVVLDNFYTLGIKNICLIAASCGRGINQLVKKMISYYSLQSSAVNVKLSKNKVNINYLQNQKDKLVIKRNQDKFSNLYLKPIKLAIVGKPNVGKSTLVNCIVGEERVVTYNLPGTTRDSIYIPIERDGYKYILIDTAGVRKKEKITEDIERISVIKTLQSIEDANVVLLVIDAKQGITNQDLSLLSFILGAGRSLVILVNKWDNIIKQDRHLIKNMLNLRLSFVNFVKIHFISALYGSGINNLFNSIHETYKSSISPMHTALLNRIMKMAEKECQPPIIRGRRVKMKYAHVGGYNPLVIIIHGNLVISLPDSYKRYLVNYFCRILHIIGTPVRIQFKESNNPYIAKK